MVEVSALWRLAHFASRTLGLNTVNVLDFESHILLFFSLFSKFYFEKNVYFVCCTAHVCGSLGGHKSTLVPLELESHVVVSRPVCWESHPVLREAVLFSPLSGLFGETGGRQR